MSESSGSEEFPESASKRRRVDLGANSVPSRIRKSQKSKDEIVANENIIEQLPTKPLEDSSFQNLGVDPWIIASLSAMQITKPTPIQAQTIPAILAGSDCIGGSKTGSGKTVAFSVPILQKWAEDGFGIFALVLTPTRFVLLR
jgi:ATP-dependent RNA helicase DDX49/DBP8